MVEQINSFLEMLVGYIWSLPMVCLLVGGGLFFTIYLGGVQFRLFKHAIDVVRGKFDDPNDPGEINHFSALCTALSGTVGLGNIAGVAVAIKAGGPGATIWMIAAGLIGMATKFTECSLAVMYREVGEDGHVKGGPMYYISKGLPPAFKPLAYFFSFCCVFAAFGAANMFQSNQVAAIAESSFGMPPLVTGVVLGVLTGIVIIGGIQRIGAVAGTIVPVMGVGYVSGCLVTIVLNISLVPEMFLQMFEGAMSGTAAAGGFAGVVVREVLVNGVRRAVFSNEAGLGTAAIAHSAARTDEPVREGVVALLEPFIDTVVICTMTALVINITGVWTGNLTGVELTAAALDHNLPGFGKFFIPVAVFCFAFSTIIAWSYYGEKSTEFLLGPAFILPYKILFCGAVVVGSVWSLAPILNFSDSALGLMVLPNMFCLFFLARTVKKELGQYMERVKEEQS